MSYVSLKEFGYNFLGPLASYFAGQVVANLENDEKVFFLSREGYFFEQFFNIWMDKFNCKYENSYLLVSRSFLFKIGLLNKETYDLSLNCNFNATINTLFQSRFSMSPDEVAYCFGKNKEDKIILPDDRSKIESLIESNFEKIKEIILPKKELYADYLKKQGFFNAKKISFLDIGYNGTIQKLLVLIFNRNIDGHYLITHGPRYQTVTNEKISIRGYLKSGVKFGDGYKILDKSLIIESMLTAPVGQLVDIDVNGFKFGKKLNIQINRQDMDTIYSGAFSIIDDIKNGNYFYSKKDVEMILEKYLDNPNLIPSDTIKLFDIDDDISGNATLNSIIYWGL